MSPANDPPTADHRSSGIAWDTNPIGELDALASGPVLVVVGGGAPSGVPNMTSKRRPVRSSTTVRDPIAASSSIVALPAQSSRSPLVNRIASVTRISDDVSTTLSVGADCCAGWQKSSSRVTTRASGADACAPAISTQSDPPHPTSKRTAKVGATSAGMR